MKNDLAYWVYYQRLLRDARKKKYRPELLELLHEGTQEVANAHFNVYDRMSKNDGQILIDMGKAELAKEQALLNNVFHANVNIDLEKPGAIKELIDTLNACLNLKNVYERNKQVITANNGGQKGVFSYFNTYILSAFTARKDQILKKVLVRFVDNRQMFFDAVKSVLEEEFDKYIMPNAIKRMLNASVERGVDDKYAKAYAEILQVIKNFPNNPLSESLKKAWGLDELISQLANKIADTSQDEMGSIFKTYDHKQIVNKKGKNQTVRVNGELRSIIDRNVHYNNQASGLSLEALEDQILSMVVEGIPDFHVGNGNFEIDGTVDRRVIKGLGYKKMRPDGAVIIGIDGEPIEQAISGTDKDDRKTATDLFNRIGKYVEGVKDGFIVYTSAKNYTLNDNFLSRGGYSAGTAITLDMLESVLGRFIDNVDDLILILLNAGSGAIMEGRNGEASEVLAQAIAFALFDDWDYIGNTPTGGQSLHILNLNGVLIPLSVFLYSLGQSVKEVEGNPGDFVRVSISSAHYDTKNIENVYYMENWLKTPQFGKENTKITYHFFKNIQAFLSF